MKAERHIARMHRILEKMTVEGHIDSPDKYAAAEDVAIALDKLKVAIEQNMRTKENRKKNGQ